jgi:hypothetical protein
MSTQTQDHHAILDKFEDLAWKQVEPKLIDFIDTKVTTELLIDELGLLPHQVRPVMDKFIHFYGMGCDDGYKATLQALKLSLENNETV